MGHHRAGQECHYAVVALRILGARGYLMPGLTLNRLARARGFSFNILQHLRGAFHQNLNTMSNFGSNRDV
jgi:hypothetical protein